MAPDTEALWNESSRFVRPHEGILIVDDTTTQKELDKTLPEDLEDVAPIYEQVCDNKQDIFMKLVEKMKQDSV